MRAFVRTLAAVVLVLLLLLLDDAVTIAPRPQRLGSPVVASAGVHGVGKLRGDATARPGSRALEAGAFSFEESKQQNGMIQRCSDV